MTELSLASGDVAEGRQDKAGSRWRWEGMSLGGKARGVCSLVPRHLVCVLTGSVAGCPA